MLELRDVHKRFGSFSAIRGIDLSIESGKIFGLLGPNGAGKTTLLRMITGLLSPSSGTVSLFDSLSPENKEARKHIGYMPQQAAVYPGLSVLENITFFGRLYGMKPSEVKAQAETVLTLVDLEAKRNELVAHLSGGMIRRVMLATALVHQPSLIILDEPTAGVDPSLRLRFWKWFQQLTDGRVSILITTHHISEASLCHEVAFIQQGKLIEQGAPDQLMSQYSANDLEAAFVKATESK